MHRLRLTVACALALAVATACESSAAVPEDAGPEPRDALPRPDARPPYDAGPVTDIPESEAAAGRASCAYARGAMPWQTLGEELPLGDEIPIDHWIILMQENRSFDHYFGTMPGVEGIPEGTTSPDGSGAPVAPHHLDTYCTVDTGHSWTASHRQWNGGANDGFVTSNEPNGERAMGYYDERDLPFYWDLYSTFAMSDHHHCSVLGPTWVNRDFFLAGTSFGLVGNAPTPLDRLPADGGPFVIFQTLERAHVDWRVYYAAVPYVYGAFPEWAFAREQRGRFRDVDHFFDDLDAGTVPAVVWIDPTWDFSAGVDATDEHPHANIQLGQAWVREIITRVMASDLWPRTAIILTYDEHGGFYDHVPPPEACPPDDHLPDSGGSMGAFDRLGFRVPLAVISPYSRPGYVSDQVTDLSSIIRLLEARYSLPALSARDANAWPLLDMFDFTSPAFATPPELAEAPVDAAELAECHAAFPE